jgi:hypothetical protein
MKNQRLKQFAASLLVVLSLFVSSVAACTCSAHDSATSEPSHCEPQLSVKTEENHAHEHLRDAQIDSQADDNLAKDISASFSGNECCCVQPAPRVAAKTENIKVQKQKSAISPISEIEPILVSQLVTVKTIDFVSPFYLSDSFHNLTPGRAPPRL